MLIRFVSSRFVLPLLVCAAAIGNALAASNPYVGGWELALPGGRAGWLGVEEVKGKLQASLLWGGGSVVPLESAKLKDGQLVLQRKLTSQRKDKSGKNVDLISFETITATVDGDTLKLTSVKPRAKAPGKDTAEFAGRREPPMPPAPDLSKVKYAAPVQLFNGKDLTGWRLTDPNATSGWSVKDGVLVNEVSHEKDKPRKNNGNLRTDREFEDFNITLETRVPEGGNSGIYLRGIYEVQVMDSFGKALDPHHMGAVYSRITPSVSAEKPAGEWQTLDITLVDRHVTVVLNGKKTIDNQPLLGCTGGALWSDVTKPGPIYLQGDHTSVEYRNIVLKPVEQ